MVHPNVPAILLTPICPHTLSFRPIILPDYAELELRIPDNARCGAWVCFDGRSRQVRHPAFRHSAESVAAAKTRLLLVSLQELGHGDSVRVRMSENPVPTINKTDLTSDWFDSLERCFRWSDRTPQKPLSPPV
jgi:NAD+ kinase